MLTESSCWLSHKRAYIYGRPLLPEEESIIGPDDEDEDLPDGLPADLWF